MSWQDYATQSHRWPYVIQVLGERGVLMYFGAEHTSDPNDLQVVQLEKLWDDFRPARAFNEGGDPPVAPSRDDAVRQYGEAGFVRWLAARDGVPVASMDLPRDAQAKALREKWPSETVKMFLVARALLPCENRADCDPVAEIARILPIIDAATGFRSSPNDWFQFQRGLANLSPRTSQRHADWFDPTQSGHVFNEMARRVEDARDRDMIDVLVRAIRAGQRVFAVAGGSHVVRQERPLRAEFD